MRYYVTGLARFRPPNIDDTKVHSILTNLQNQGVPTKLLEDFMLVAPEYHRDLSTAW